jgi:tartrate dehydrogenase/decarboxylase/D-malate dehydrogenase
VASPWELQVKICLGPTDLYNEEVLVHRIAVIPGDGIGKETIKEGIRVLERVASRFGIDLSWDFFPWGCEYYIKYGQMMPKKGLEIIREYDAIYFGAVGHPDVLDHISLWGLLIPIRRGFQQYVNLRPIKLLKGISSPLRNQKPGSLDLVIVRENVEGEYSTVGGKIYEGTDQETVIQETIFTRKGVTRVMNFAFELALKRKRHLTSATKSNGITYTFPFWDQIFREISAEFTEIKADQYHIDALSALFVLDPGRFDVVVASNLFGDILSDLGPAIAGSLGLAPSANLNPEKKFPSMFEPVHGSAPDIAGKGIANPVGQIWSGAMMLEHLGYPDAAKVIENAIEDVLGTQKILTADLGGNARTEDVGKAIADLVTNL